MRAWAVVVAAGRGARSGLDVNKIFYPLAGRTALSRSIDALGESGAFEGIVLVISEADEPLYRETTDREGGHPLVRAVVYGGDTRQRSVMNGLLAVPEAIEIVAVHDAARPFATPELIRAVVESAERYGSGVAATRLVDTVKQVDADGYAIKTPDRATLCAVQTPQAFRRSELLDAYRRAEADGCAATDDAALIERYAGAARLVLHPDGVKNRKLTTKEDIDTMERALTGARRVGMGYDVHRFAEGRKLTLLGVEVPHNMGLLGHSDADVAAHAVMDALLGAAAMGDIGRHFPDADPAYKDAFSMGLLEKVVEMLAGKGYTVGNADVTIVAQRPKLAPFMDEMRARLAEVLRVSQDCVNVKATTTEGLGFEGRGEGISATAVVLIRGWSER